MNSNWRNCEHICVFEILFLLVFLVYRCKVAELEDLTGQYTGGVIWLPDTPRFFSETVYMARIILVLQTAVSVARARSCRLYASVSVDLTYFLTVKINADILL